MFKFLLWGLILYLMYGFLKHFLIPIFTSVSQMKQGVKNMEDKFNQFANKQQSATEVKKETKKETKGEYIEFEEIKK